MKSSKALFFALGLSALVCNSAEATEPSQLVSPLQCQSPEHCKQSPENLEKFLTRVYAWYLEQHSNDTSHLKKLLTPQFYSIYINSMKSYDGDNASLHCTDHDTDPLFCLYYYPEPTTTHIRAKFMRQSSTSATLQLNLVDKKYNQSNRLYVKMVPINKMWLIDRVTDLDNDK
jgi:hypothetical protein